MDVIFSFRVAPIDEFYEILLKKFGLSLNLSLLQQRSFGIDSLRVSVFRQYKSSSSKTEFFVYTFSRNSPLIYYQEGNRKALISWSSEEVNGQTLNPTLTWDVGLAAITRRPVLRKMTR